MAHCMLTEPSLKAHARKGREGKGNGSLGRQAPCIVKVVTRGLGETGSDRTSRDRFDACDFVGAIS